MNRIWMVPLFAATLAVSSTAQGSFVDLVVGTMTTPDGKAMPFRYYQLGSRIRNEYTIENSTMSTIYDGTTGDMLMMMPQQKKYMVMNMRSGSATARQLARGMSGRGSSADGAPDFSKMKVTATGRRETIAGISCEHYLFQNTEKPDSKPMDMCGATGMGFMGMAGEGGSMMPSTIALLRSQNPELARIARQGFFPLKMTFSGPKGDASWTVVSIDRRRPDAALFQPPAGYTEMVVPSVPGMPGRKP